MLTYKIFLLYFTLGLIYIFTLCSLYVDHLYTQYNAPPYLSSSFGILWIQTAKPAPLLNLECGRWQDVNEVDLNNRQLGVKRRGGVDPSYICVGGGMCR